MTGRDAGLVLAFYLSQVHHINDQVALICREIFTQKAKTDIHVLELGSGVGLVGITIAQMIPCCKVLLTDLLEAQEVIQTNIAHSRQAPGSNSSFHVLNWGADLKQSIKDISYDLIMFSDCTYNPSSGPKLIKTLTNLLSISPKAVVLVAMKKRHQSENVFFTLMAAAGFFQVAQTSVPIPNRGGVQSELASANIDIYIYKKSP